MLRRVVAEKTVGEQVIWVPRGLVETDQTELCRSEITQLVAVFVGALLLILSVAIPIGLIVHFASMPIDYAALNALFIEETRGYLMPEPGERATYLATVLVTLPSALISISLVGWFSNTHDVQRRLASFSGPALIILSIPIAAVFVESEFMASVFGRSTTSNHELAPGYEHFYLSRLLLVCGAITLAAIGTHLYLHQGKLPVERLNRIYSRLASYARWTNLALATAVLLTVVATRIRPASIVDGDGHFEAVFYSVSQVMAGKTVIADLPAQYGLYAELLHPLFATIGISVLTFTIVMTLLQGLASLAIFRVLIDLVKLTGLQLLAGLTLCWFLGSTWISAYSSPIGHEYYQVWPIRFLFPGLLTFLFSAMRRRGVTTWQTVGVAILSGIAIIWNIDSGVPAAGALFVYLLVRSIFGKAQDRGRNVRLLVIGGLVPVAVVAAFFLYLSVKAGGDIHLVDWIKYQRIFYASGFGMLPMPRQPDPWMAVLGIYLFGVVGAIFMHQRSKASVSWDIILYLSILGLGLFTYYQGRSHVNVLTAVMWPAILIGFILADRTLRAVRAHILSVSASWSAMPIVVFGLMMSFLWFSAAPQLVEMTVNEARFIKAYRNDSTPTAENIAFIKAKVGVDRTAAIFDPGQSVYFGETGLASAIPGPGIGEMILLADQHRILVALKEHPVSHLFIRLGTDGKIPTLYRPYILNYRALGASKAGLEYLEPRDKIPGRSDRPELNPPHG